jgi:N-sulfoglucosamine sulfohydrolase
VLFFLVDDGGFEIGTFGNNVTNTPNIDGLAARAGATVYDRAYTAVSSCSPSRSAILTGLPTHQNGMYGLHQYPGNFQSNTNVHSLPNLLNKACPSAGDLLDP